MMKQKQKELCNFSKATQPGGGGAVTRTQAVRLVPRQLATTLPSTCFVPAVLLALFHLLPGRGRYFVWVFFLFLQMPELEMRDKTLPTQDNKVKTRVKLAPPPQTCTWILFTAPKCPLGPQRVTGMAKNLWERTRREKRRRGTGPCLDSLPSSWDLDLGC